MYDASTIHILNPFLNACGGSERRALALRDLLRTRRRVRLWRFADKAPDPEIAAAYPLETIRGLHFPRGGTIVCVGGYFRIGEWIRLAFPQRVVLVFNTPDREDFLHATRRLARARRPIEYRFASDALRRLAGAPGGVELSPIDLERFVPRPADASRPFTVGRLSRDSHGKHHPDDPELYRRLAAAGCRVRVMGGMSLAPFLAGVPGVELLPEGAAPAEEFLAGLDVFLYRTGPDWLEPHGRVVTEAMAAGLPVVCHARGGYTEFVRDGENGLLFGTNGEAAAAVARLRAAPALRRALGAQARADMERRLGPAYRAEIVDFYCRAAAAQPFWDVGRRQASTTR
ncbi:MAG: glycosyltransferase [Candidatus Polarisedimenticolia bacterium]